MFQNPGMPLGCHMRGVLIAYGESRFQIVRCNPVKLLRQRGPRSLHPHGP